MDLGNDTGKEGSPFRGFYLPLLENPYSFSTDQDKRLRRKRKVYFKLLLPNHPTSQSPPTDLQLSTAGSRLNLSNRKTPSPLCEPIYTRTIDNRRNFIRNNRFRRLEKFSNGNSLESDKFRSLNSVNYNAKPKYASIGVSTDP